MRLSKRLIKESIRGHMKRQNELCAIMATNGIKDEFKRCFPHADSIPEREEECLRQLLNDALERGIPSHWYDE